MQCLFSRRRIGREAKRRPLLFFVPWCNGNTTDFGSVIQGSNPCGTTKLWFMKMILVGVFSNPFSTNHAHARGFEANGVEVVQYDYRERLKLLDDDIARRDDELIQKTKEEKPDVVFFSKCNNMSHRVLDEVNKLRQTILWYMDASNNYDQELQEKIARASLCVSGLEDITHKMKKLNPNSIFVHQCPDELDNFKKPDAEKKLDALFIGNMGTSIHSDRKNYLDKVGFHHRTGVFGKAHNALVNQTKVNLNFAPTDSAGCSVRLYKIMAAGGFVLTTPWRGISKTFQVGEHLDTFSTPEELKRKIEFYVQNDEERERIALNGYKLVHSRFMPKQWAKIILDELSLT